MSKNRMSGLETVFRALVEKANDSSEPTLPAPTAPHLDLWDFRHGLSPLEELITNSCADLAGYLPKNHGRDMSMEIPGRSVARHVLASAVASAFLGSLNRVAIRCESPSEEILLYAFVASTWARSEELYYYDGQVSSNLSLGETGRRGSMFTLQPQAQVGGYRLDFLITYRTVHYQRPELGWLDHQVAVECDGHDFHERTAEQATRDKQRDRDLSSLNIPVLRITGQEISRDPLTKASWVLDHVRHQLWRGYYLNEFRNGGLPAFDEVSNNHDRRSILERDTGMTADEWAQRLKTKNEPLL